MNKFGHMELNTDDPQAAREFYGKLFDWTITDVPMADGSSYILIEGLGGIHKKPAPQAPTQWIGYVTVESLDASVAKVKELGGRVLMDRMEVPAMGFFAVAADPTGGTFALWEEHPDRTREKAAEAKESKKKAKKKAERKAEKKEKKAEKKARKAEKKEKRGKKDKKRK